MSKDHVASVPLKGRISPAGQKASFHQILKNNTISAGNTGIWKKGSRGKKMKMRHSFVLYSCKCQFFSEEGKKYDYQKHDFRCKL